MKKKLGPLFSLHMAKTNSNIVTPFNIGPYGASIVLNVTRFSHKLISISDIHKVNYPCKFDPGVRKVSREISVMKIILLSWTQWIIFWLLLLLRSHFYFSEAVAFFTSELKITNETICTSNNGQSMHLITLCKFRNTNNRVWKMSKHLNALNKLVAFQIALKCSIR